ncbi:MAG TPA: CoA transferase [Candidatus Acidoferrales bacterium]|nr:CoA transferase [Candidatus Acidoferrales bacterium]
MLKVLDGVRLIEAAEWFFVPGAGTVLADWGVDVVKIEHPTRGDPLRGLISSGMVPGASGLNFFIENGSRNKRSIGLDLAAERGREILYKMVEKADVFLTSFLPAARRRLKIDVDDLRKINPKLIYAKGSGQGPKGPEAERGGFDAGSFWSRGGVAHMLSEPGKAPIMQRAAFGDTIGATFIAGGIAAALYHREKTGQATTVDVSLLGTACWLMAPDILGAIVLGRDLPHSDRSRAPNPLMNTYLCQDGKWLMLMMLTPMRHWDEFCKAIEREDLLQEYPLMKWIDEQVRFQLVDVLNKHFATRSRLEWMDRLLKYDTIHAPVQTPTEIRNDPQVLANGYLVDYTHPQHGPFKVASSPVQFNAEPTDVRRVAPEVGQDTEDILLDHGLSWEEIAKLKEGGVIA